MDARDELDRLQQRIRRIEQDLASTRTAMVNLEQRLAGGTQPEIHAPLPEMTAEPSLSPPPLPPPLPVVAHQEHPASPTREFTPEFDAPAPDANPTPVRLWLERLQLWPPSGEGNAEVRLGAWWATRLGALFAVIGVVSFGIYVSRGTPPWVKFAELLAVTAAICGLGLWLERRIARFGSVLLGAGLALLYFCAYAAYALPAVQVIAQAGTAALWQFATVAIVLAVAWRRDSEATASLAVILGFLAVGFTFSHSLGGTGLVYALALTSAAAVLRVAKHWAAPLSLAIVPAWIVHLMTTGLLWHRFPAEFGGPWPWLVALVLVMTAGDFLVVWSRQVSVTHGLRWRQGLQSALAIAAGVWAAWGNRDALTLFYFSAGAVALGLTFAWRIRLAGDTLVAVLFAKAAGLVSLGVITGFDARTRWLVLLVQSLILLAGVRREGSRVLAVLALLVWMVAAVFYLQNVTAVSYTLMSLTGLTSVFFLAGSAAVVAWLERLMAEDESVRLQSVVAGLFCGLLGAVTVWGWRETGWVPALAIAVAGLLAMGGGLVRSRSTVIAAAPVLLTAHLELMTMPQLHLWPNAAVVFLGSWLAFSAWRKQLGERLSPQVWLAGGTFLVGLTTTTLVLVGHHGLHPSWSLVFSTFVAFVLGVLARWTRPFPLAALSVWPLALGLWCSWSHPGGQGDGAYALAAALAWITPAWISRRAAAKEANDRCDDRGLPGLSVILAVFYTLVALETQVVPGLLWAFAGALAFIFVVARFGCLREALPALTVLAVLAAGTGVLPVRGSSGWVEPLAATTVLAVVMVAVPVLARMALGDPRPQWRTSALWLHGAGALFLIMTGVLRGVTPLAPYATVGWGLAAVALFIAGLTLRERPYRLLGLMGIALCVPRLFLIDLNSTLYRIFAFAALGVVLLWVGFSYHRFRHLVSADQPEKDES